MGIADARTKLKGRLDTITGIDNHAQVPDVVPKAPFTALGIEGVSYDETFGGAVTYHFRLLLCVAERDSKAAYDALDDYLETSGAKSIKAAIEGDSVGAPHPDDYAEVIEAENVGHLDYRGTTFIGAEFVINVVAPS